MQTRHNWVKSIQSKADKVERLCIGLMSGTSVDGITVAICKIRGGGLLPATKVELIHTYEFPYPDTIKSNLLRSLELKTQDIAELHVLVAEAFAEAVVAALDDARIRITDIDVIGSHGQTIYHHSSGRQIKASLQIGDGDVIAERTGVLTISDFRARDIAAGGQGAPLTPYADWVFFNGGSSSGRVVLNLGGVANLTVLTQEPEKIIGFDSGPANGPLDRLARIITNGGENFDKDGLRARRGTINRPLLERLLREDPYLKLPPPKSTGFEMYGDKFVAEMIAEHGRADDDLLATITEFSAQTIANALQAYSGAAASELIIAGGGYHNTYLIERIGELIKPVRLVSSDALGVPVRSREAMAFALFANDALLGMPASLPSVTGARGSRILGKFSLPLER